MELLKLLAPHNATLTDAVKFYLRHVAATASKTVEKLLPDYLQTKANPQYRKDQEFSLRLFAKEFGARPVNAVEAPAIERWLRSNNWKPLTMRNRLRDLAMFFKWAKFHGQIAENPCDRIRRPKVARSTPVIFTADDLLLDLSAHRKCYQPHRSSPAQLVQTSVQHPRV